MPASAASSSRRSPVALRRRPAGTPTASGASRSRQRRTVRPNSQASTGSSVREPALGCPGPGSPTKTGRVFAARQFSQAGAMTEPGTVLITGPTRNLGRHAVLAVAGRPDGRRPDLLLVGRAGRDLTAVADEARALGARVHAIGCDLASLADVRAAAVTARGLIDGGAVRPLRALVANAGTMSADTRRASADGYELTCAVNRLAHAQLIGDLLASFAAPARIVLIGSNTYQANFWRKLLHVPEAKWADPVELARPAGG